MILVTGATGHLGGAVARQLVDRSDSVRAMVRDKDRAAHLAELGIELAVGDILDAEAVDRSVKGCSAVLHCAAGFVMWSRDVERDIIRPSVDGTRHVLEAAHRHGAERVLYVSTSGTIPFASTADIEIDESQTVETPHTHYLRGKLAAENWARDFVKRTQLPVVIVNPGLILGPGFHRISESVKMVADFVDHGQPMVFPGGFAITDVDDIAAAAIVGLERGRSGERYLLAGEHLRIRAMFDELSDLTGLPRPSVEIPVWAARMLAWLVEGASRLTGRQPMIDRASVAEFAGKYQNMPSTKAHDELDFAPRPARETLARTVAWLVARGFVRENRLAKLKINDDARRCFPPKHD